MTTIPPAAARERMSRVDTAWLRMDNDVNLMMIVGVWLLTPAIAYETLCRRVEERLLRYERFRHVVVRDANGAYWRDDDDFDIRHHVVRDRDRTGRRDRRGLPGLQAGGPVRSADRLSRFSRCGRERDLVGPDHDPER